MGEEPDEAMLDKIDEIEATVMARVEAAKLSGDPVALKAALKDAQTALGITGLIIEGMVKHYDQ